MHRRGHSTAILVVVAALCSATAGPAAAQASRKAEAFGPGPFLDDAQIRAPVLVTGERIWASSDQRSGMRVQRYDAMLPRGTILRPALPDSEDVLVCENACWFHFVDLAPGAHFAHPVVYVVTDATTGVQATLEATWWPEISGPWIERTEAFSKVEQRRDPVLTILHKPAVHEPGPALEDDTGADLPMPPAATPGFLSALGDPCDAWAIIVCAYDDLSDTFDEDTNGSNVRETQCQVEVVRPGRNRRRTSVNRHQRVCVR